jgi:uncharacterized protein (TIGR00251 family)
LIELETSDHGVILPVRAQPGSQSSGIRGVHNGVLKVSVTQVAEKGKANKALIAVLGKQLGLRKSQIELISGQTAAHKRFLVREISENQLRERIERAVGRGD